jgi:hypothetical protein
MDGALVEHQVGQQRLLARLVDVADGRLAANQAEPAE